MIKKLALFAVLALATATPAKAAELTDAQVKTCELAGDLAKSVMMGRQYGFTPSQLRKNMQKILAKLGIEMERMVLVDIYIQEAYQSPRYPGGNILSAVRELQEWEINNFQSEKEAHCLRYFLEEPEA